jgi:hypothetical protein
MAEAAKWFRGENQNISSLRHVFKKMVTFKVVYILGWGAKPGSFDFRLFSRHSPLSHSGFH